MMIETESHVLPIEIKSTSNPRVKDAANLIAFQNEYGKKSRAGLLLHNGKETNKVDANSSCGPLVEGCLNKKNSQ